MWEYVIQLGCISMLLQMVCLWAREFCQIPARDALYLAMDSPARDRRRLLIRHCLLVSLDLFTSIICLDLPAFLQPHHVVNHVPV